MKNPCEKKGIRKRVSLRTLMVLFVFLIMLASILIIGSVAGLLMHFGIFNPFGSGRNPLLPLAGILAFSLLMGTLLAAIVSNHTLKPLRKIIDATHQVAGGDFTVQLPTGNIPEIDDLNDSFNTMVRELGSIETLRSDFISSFSHEFKTPIVSIRGFAKLLRDKGIPEEERDEYVEIIIQESERLAQLSTNILNLTKLESVGILADKQDFDLDEQVRRVAALLEPRWREKALTVTLELERMPVHSDEELLWQVWVNLLENAIKFTETGGHIAITLNRDGANAVLAVADDGCGMDENTLAHLYDKFFQADASHSGNGNGLGLSLAGRIVTLCGGSIRVESRPGAGSRFTVTLPAGRSL